MARSNEQTKLKPQLQKLSSFSWDNAFFTSDGVLDADELSSMINEGDGNNLKHQLQPIQEIENLEAKLFEETEASTKKSNKSNTQPTSSSLNNVKSSTTMAKNNTKSKIDKSKSDSPSKTKSKSNSPAKTKSKPDSPSKTPPGKINANFPSHLGFSNLSPRSSSPRSPTSPGSSSSTSAFNQRSSKGRSSSAPRRSSSTNTRRKVDEQKPGKLSSVTLKNKSPPVNSLPLSPLGLINSSSCTSLASSSSSSSSHKVNKRSISTGRGATVRPRSLNRDSSASSALKTLPTSKTGSPNGAKERKIQATTKTVQTGLKSNPQRGGKERGVRNIFVVSPEILDMKGKLNALKMEISMQKKDKCKETKMVPAKIGKSESCSSIYKNSSSKMNNQARRI